MTTATTQETSPTRSNEPTFHFHVEYVQGSHVRNSPPIGTYYRAAALAAAEAHLYSAGYNALHDGDTSIERSQYDSQGITERRYRHKGTLVEWSVFPDDASHSFSARVYACQDADTMDAGQLSNAFSEALDQVVRESFPGMTVVVQESPVGSATLGY